jgi:hypothetical protein
VKLYTDQQARPLQRRKMMMLVRGTGVRQLFETCCDEGPLRSLRIRYQEIEIDRGTKLRPRILCRDICSLQQDQCPVVRITDAPGDGRHG